MFKISRFFGRARKAELSRMERAQIARLLQEFAAAYPVRDKAEVCLTPRMDAKTLFQGAQKEQLTSTEKAEGLSVLRSYMNAHPIQESVSDSEAFFSLFSFNRFAAAITAIVVLVGAGGTASYAAEDSLPGDFLYSFKIHVNEPLQEAFAMSPEAKASVQIKHMQRRFSEAEQLAINQNLNKEVAARLEARIQESMDKIESRINDLGEENSISSEYDLALETQENLWKEYDKEDDGSDVDRGFMMRIASSSVANDIDITVDLSHIFKHVKDARERISSTRKFAKEAVDDLEDDIESTSSTFTMETGSTIRTTVSADGSHTDIETTSATSIRINTNSDTDTTMSITTSSGQKAVEDDHDEDDEDEDDDEEDLDLEDLEDFINSQIDNEDFDIEALDEELQKTENSVKVHSESTVKVKNSVKVGN